MKRAIAIVFSVIIFVLAQTTVFYSFEGCTSAVVSHYGSKCGAPILWKNRDTSYLSNKVVFVKETPYSYIALVNSDDSSGRICYAGINEKGFAIINTVAYNLPQKNGEQKDLEGFLMAEALRKCSTISDFGNYLKANLGPDLGARTNFEIIDSRGRAALFEVSNHAYKEYDPARFPGNYIVVTNFARSGRNNAGQGYLRFERASSLFRSTRKNKISFYDILHLFSRDFGNTLVRHPLSGDLRMLPASTDYWISSYDCIDRYSTSACVVFVGKNLLKPQLPATMWVIPGEPLTAVAVPLWVESGKVPVLLWKGKRARMWEESSRIKKIVRPFVKGNMMHYIRLNKLDNRDHVGYLPLFLKTEKEIVNETVMFLKKQHTQGEYMEFQEKMVKKAYETMKKVH